jgi:hypothetical protein
MSGRNILVVVLVPVAVLVPVVMVKMLVKDVDPILPNELLRHYEVVTADYYGVRLDEKATPRDVAYVLLRSIEDGAKAVGAPAPAEQVRGLRQARETQLAVAAPQTILQFYQQAGYPMEGSMAEEKVILKAVLGWSQLLGYYVGGFGLDHREAWTEMIEPSSHAPSPKAMVLFEAKKNEFKTGVAVRLAREADRWRIYMVNFADLRPRPPGATTAPAATGPSATRPAAEPTKPEPTKVELPKAEPTKVEPPKTEPPKTEPPRTEATSVPATSKPQPVPTQPVPKPEPTPAPGAAKPVVATAPVIPQSRPASGPATTQAQR